jgi:UDP-N-acetylglucosamine:LPS N-acetylglucosamine transferase
MRAAHRLSRGPAEPNDQAEQDTHRVLLVCSSGGHLQQMLALEPAWTGAERMWVTLPGPDVEHLLAGEPYVFAHGPTNRSITKLVRNVPFAFQVIRRFRPDTILSTGAGPAVPFFLAGKMLGCRLVYVESLTRIHGLSLSARLVRPFADEFFVQWPEAARRTRAQFAGNVMGSEAA